jgi:hypothetical protein
MKAKVVNLSCQKHKSVKGGHIFLTPNSSTTLA